MFKKLYSNNKKILITLSSVFALLLFPLKTVALDVSFMGILTALPSSQIGIFMGVTVLLTNLFAKITGALLNWVTSPGFMSLSYTDPARNEIIRIGLDITKNFVNLGLVVALVFIAIAISLQIREYGTKKTFIKLVIVALLVNFAPVICGLIVDATNIVMHFFLAGIGQGVSGILTGIDIGDIFSDLVKITFGSLSTKGSLMAKGSTMIILNISIGFAFFLFAFIFLFRYVAIWILVILSPLALVSWILPSTKSFWDLWWKQLIQWSIIGIPLAFFLYLAIRSATVLNETIRANLKAPGLDAPLTGFLDNIIPYFVIIAMIYFGFFIALKTTAMGSSAAIRAGKWSHAKTFGRVGRGVARMPGTTAKKIGRGLKPTVEGMARKTAGGVYSRMIKLGNWSPTAGGRFKPFAISKWAAPKKLKEFGNLKPTIDKGMEDAKGNSGAVIGDELANEKIKGAEATGWYSQLLAQNDSQDLFEAFKRKIGKGAGGKKWKDMNDEEITSDKDFKRIMAPILVDANNSGKLGSILRRDPRLAEVAYEKNIGSYGRLDKDGKPQMASAQVAVNKAVTEARDHLKDWEPESLKSQKVTGGVMAHLDRDRQLQVNRQIKNGQDTQLKTMDEMFSDFVRGNKKSILGKSDLSESKIAELLADIIDDETGVSTETADHKKAWREFDKHIKENFGDRKYFVSVEDDRFKKTGWRKMNFIPQGDSDDSSLNTPPSSPAIGLGMGPLGQKVNVKPTPTTGAGGSKKTKTPTTGKQAKINPILTDSQIDKLRKMGWPDERIKGFTSREQADIIIFG